jgi:hypothetical protein
LSSNNTVRGFYGSIARQQADAEQAYNDPSIGRPARVEFWGSTWAGLADELVNGGTRGRTPGK